MDAKILLIDDDINFTNAFTFAFGKDYRLHIKNSFTDGLASIEDSKYDLILIDHHLQDKTGLELVSTIRMRGLNMDTPVFIITALPDLDMAIEYLNADVQGFITKPIEYTEIAAKIERTLNQNPMSKTQKLDWITVDYRLRKVQFDQESVTLTPTELQILDIFLQNQGKAIHREEICEKIWGKRAVSKNSFDTHLLNLRKKVNPLNTRLISVYGSGYILS